MLVAMRKHTKVVFWIIIILLVPAFAVFYVPRVFRATGHDVKYGSIYGKTISVRHFYEARDAEYRALSDFYFALVALAYRKPQYDFLRARRDVYLAQLAAIEGFRGEMLTLDEAREQIKRRFTDRQTGEYDEAAYKKRLREVGMTDEEYVAEVRDNMKIERYQVLPALMGQDEWGQRRQRDMTWMRLMLSHEAERLGIPVTDEEVLDYLTLICPGENGTIDEERYAERLRDVHKARASYEQEIRTTIRIAKLQRMVLDSVKAPEPTVTERFNEQYRTFKLAYHLEPYGPLMEPAALRDDEVLAFYVRNRGWNEELQIEPRVAVLYVLVETKAFEPEAQVEDKQVRDYYEAHRQAFTDADGVALPYEMCEKQVRATVVKQEAEKLARGEASRVFLVNSPVRLIQEAAKRGYPVHSTPLFGKEGRMDDVIADDEEDFRDAAFALQPGEVSAHAVKVKQGWCVLSATRVTPAPQGVKHRPFSEVAAVARTEAARERARDLAREVSDGLFERVEKLMSDEQIGFLDACDRLDIGVTQTGFLGKEAKEVPGLEEAHGLLTRAALPEDRIEYLLTASDRPAKIFYVLDVEEGALFFNVLERRDPDASVRAQKEPEFAKDVVRRSLQGVAYDEWQRALLAVAKIRDLAEEQRQAAQQRQQTAGGGLGQ
jgi:hypothetical protein